MRIYDSPLLVNIRFFVDNDKQLKICLDEAQDASEFYTELNEPLTSARIRRLLYDEAALKPDDPMDANAKRALVSKAIVHLYDTAKELRALVERVRPTLTDEDEKDELNRRGKVLDEKIVQVLERRFHPNPRAFAERNYSSASRIA